MKLAIATVLLGLFLLVSCIKKEDVKRPMASIIEGSEPVNEKIDDNFLSYEFDVSDKYRIRVEFQKGEGWPRYFINDSDRYGVLALAQHHLDVQYANIEMYSKDIDGDGYSDLVVSNVQESKTIEKIYYFDPKEVELTPRYNEYDYCGRSLENLIGFVTLDMDVENFKAEEEINFLNNDNTTWLKFLSGDLDVAPNVLHSDKQSEVMYGNWLDLHPWLFLFEVYRKVIFRCEAVDDDYYTVVVNDQTHEVKRLKKTDALRFETLEEHLTGMLTSPVEDRFLLQEPGDDSFPVEPSGDIDRCAEIEGDWMRLENIYDDTTVGWVRWRKNDKLLVNISYIL